MNKHSIFSILLVCVSLVLLAESGVAQSGLDIKLIKNERLRAILALPSALTVTHSPNPVSAKPHSDPTYRYIWPYTTIVSPKIEALTVVEFGGFLYRNGAWVFANDTGKAFGPGEFKEWYAAPADGVLLTGKKYPDPKNRTVASKLEGQKALWYFIAQGKDGKKYQGYSVIQCQARLEKAKATPSPSNPSGGKQSK